MYIRLVVAVMVVMMELLLGTEHAVMHRLSRHLVTNYTFET